MSGVTSSEAIRQQAPELFLDLYYPFHYKVGFAVEDALRGETLTQHQTVILWIVHYEGSDGVVRRKDVERRIGDWFDVTSSAISKALRSMARPEMGLVRITEDARSGREKVVALTAKGRAHVERMRSRANALIGEIVAELTPEEIRSGLHFLERVSQIVEDLRYPADRLVD